MGEPTSEQPGVSPPPPAGPQAPTANICIRLEPGCEELRGALGVTELELQQRFYLYPWGRGWGFGVRGIPGLPLSTSEVAWSYCQQLRVHDRILAIGDRVVMHESADVVQQLINSHANKGRMRVTVDTRRSWPTSFSAQYCGAGEGSRCRMVRKLVSFLVDGFDGLLDARVCPARKILSHAAAMLVLFPLLLHSFSALHHLADRDGPLLVPTKLLINYQAVWSSLYLSCPLLTLILRLSLGSSLPDYGCMILRRLSLLLRVLDLSLYLPILLAAGTMATTGLSIPPAATKAQHDQEVRHLAHTLECLIFVPFLAGWYLRRVSCFCSAYADLAESKPRRLHLTMPISSNFTRPGDGSRETFTQLRIFGF